MSELKHFNYYNIVRLLWWLGKYVNLLNVFKRNLVSNDFFSWEVCSTIREDYKESFTID